MITITNLLQRPQIVGGKSLGVDSEMKVKLITEEMQRLSSKGFIAIVVDEPVKTTTSPNAGNKENK